MSYQAHSEHEGCFVTDAEDEDNSSFWWVSVSYSKEPADMPG